MIAEILADLDKAVLDQRLLWFTHTLVYSMAHCCQLHPTMESKAFDRYTEELIDYCMGGLLGCKPPPRTT